MCIVVVVGERERASERSERMRGRGLVDSRSESERVVEDARDEMRT